MPLALQTLAEAHMLGTAVALLLLVWRTAQRRPHMEQLCMGMHCLGACTPQAADKGLRFWDNAPAFERPIAGFTSVCGSSRTRRLCELRVTHRKRLFKGCRVLLDDFLHMRASK